MFEPDCEMAGKRRFLVAQHRREFGTYLFDGAQLFAIRRLHEENNLTIEVESRDDRDNQMYKVRLTYARIVPMNEKQSMQILNLVLRKAKSGLNLQLVGRNFYDAESAVS